MFILKYEEYGNPETEEFKDVDKALEFIRSRANDGDYGRFELYRLEPIPFVITIALAV